MAILTPTETNHSVLANKKKHNATRNTFEPDMKRERELKPSVSLDVKPENCQARRRGMAKVGKACDRCKLKKCKVGDIRSLYYSKSLTCLSSATAVIRVSVVTKTMLYVTRQNDDLHQISHFRKSESPSVTPDSFQSMDANKSQGDQGDPERA